MPLFVACASVTPPASPLVFQAESSRSDSEVVVIARDGQTIVEVWSESGIGDAAVSLQAGVMPNAVLIRLHLAGLEEFKFGYGDTIVTASVLSSGDRPILQSVAIGGETPTPIEPASPYWLQIAYTAPSSATTMNDGYFQVATPPDFVASGGTAFDIAWIDFYR